MEHVKDRVVVADRGGHQPLGIICGGRDDDLEPGHVGEGGIERLRVLAGVGIATADGSGDDQRHAKRAAREIDVLGRHVVNRVHADSEEVDKHQLCDRPHAGHGGAHRRAQEPGLGDRRIDNALGPELVVEPGRRAKDAAIDTDVLPHHEDIGIGAHFLRDGFRHGS